MKSSFMGYRTIINIEVVGMGKMAENLIAAKDVKVAGGNSLLN